MLFEKNDKLVFIGDSITDYERARPVGEGLFGAIGQSYVGIVEGLLAASEPDAHIRVVNMGTGGNTVLDLKERWETDAIGLHPDWLAIYIGINDVWRQFDSPLQTEQHVSPEVFEATYRQLIESILPSLKGLILMTPHFLEPNRQDPMRIRMDQYGEIVKKLAKEYGAVLVDTQQAFDDFLQYNHPMVINWDRIHPNVMGHCILAKAFLKAVGYQW
ncbi:MAG: SGNH/GDSL hydrolase family protein [Oscillospiraceae bacterium]|nr:SGNH/GDSL hydrolase family protein [Oscillospiraceae bacterium]